MAYITKRGNSYSVRYTYQDEHGKCHLPVDDLRR